MRAIDEWATAERAALIHRKLSRQAGISGDAVASATLKRQAAHRLLRCTYGLRKPAPESLVYLIMELLDANVPPEIPVSQDKQRAWRRVVVKASSYPEQPDAAFSKERPRRRASLRELEVVGGVSKKTIKAWVRLPAFSEACHAQREWVRRATGGILGAPVNAQD